MTNDLTVRDTSNRLATPSKGGKVTREQLFDLAEKYNRFEWVKASGHPYFVTERPSAENEGVMEAYLARNN